MGLSISYTLRLPGSRSRDNVLELLQTVRERSTPLKLEEISPVFDLTNVIKPNSRGEGLLMWWSQLVADGSIEDEDPKWYADQESTIGFSVYPGEGCEPATFALMKRRCETSATEEWFWWAATKTQYASNHGDEHFLNIHTSLISILDAVRDVGIELEVFDDGDYWETRSRGKLLGHVRQSNHIIAKFTGALSDAIGDAHGIEAPILEHPEFEHIEMDDLPCE